MIGIAVAYDIYDTFIFDNTLINNTGGIVIQDTHNTTIEQNEVMDNLDAGIMLMQNNDTLISDNFISDNGDYGMPEHERLDADGL